jgi:hypothetical protein
MTTRTNLKDQLFDLAHDMGNFCWRRFCRSPGGLFVLVMLPNDDVRDRAKLLYMLGFGDRMIDGLFDDLGSAPVAELSQKSWQGYLDRAEGRILLDGSAYPNSPDKVLAVAQHIYRLGYADADFLLNHEMTL